MRQTLLSCFLSLSSVAGLVACSKGSTLTTSPGHLGVFAGGMDVSGGSDDFGQCCPGFPIAQTLTLTNTGDVEVDVSALQVTGDFSLTPTPSFPIPVGPGMSSTFDVTFTPASGQAGGQAGTLTITSDAADGGVTVALTGTVSSAPAQPTFGSSCTFNGQMRAPCAFLDFGSVAVGSSSSQTIQVQNTGCPALTVAASLGQDGGAYSLGSFPASLQLGQSAPLTVTFQPTTAISAPAELVFTTNDPLGGAGEPAGQFAVTLTGFGAAAQLTLSPNTWAAPAGGVVGQTFTVQNGGSAPIALESPAIVEQDDAGVFALDAGWAAGFLLDAGASVSCVVTADLPGSGVFGAELIVPNGTSQLTASLTGNALADLCTSPLLSFDAGWLCGPPLTKSLQIFVCDGGDAPLDIRAISLTQNPGGTYALTLPAPASGPWTVSPGSPGITVGVSFQDDGTLQQANDQIAIASNATSQPILNVPIANSPAYVPPATGVPVLVDGGPMTVGSTLLFQVQPAGAPNYAYLFYWVGQSTGLDAGLVVLSGVPGADVAFTPEVAASGYRVCVDEIEIDAGQGNCGFDAGLGTGRSAGCSQVIAVGS